MSSDLPAGWKLSSIVDVMPEAAVARLAGIVGDYARGVIHNEADLLRIFKAEVIDAFAAEIRSRGNDPQFVYYAIAHALGWL